MKTVYSVTIEVPRTPEAVFDVLINQVTGYWPEDIEGTIEALNDEFIFRSGADHYSKNRVTEFVPGKKLAWVVTDSIRKTDNFSWTGSRMIFDLSPEKWGTRISFIYDGYVFDDELERLQGLCDMVVKDRLYQLLVSGSITVTVATPASPDVVFRALLNVKQWWGFDDLQGPTAALHDIFTIHHPGTHYSKQQITEFVPGKRLVFSVIESRLDWLQNPDEWSGTRMIFDLSPGQLCFTHEGLTPEKECYERVNEGWQTIISEYFLKSLVV